MLNTIKLYSRTKRYPHELHFQMEIDLESISITTQQIMTTLKRKLPSYSKKLVLGEITILEDDDTVCYTIEVKPEDMKVGQKMITGKIIEKTLISKGK